MADQLQALLDRINEKGIKQAEADRDDLLAGARSEAKQLVADARKEAEHIVQAATREADLLMAKGSESLQQAARDTLLSLRAALGDRMAAVVQACFGKEIAGDVLGRIVAQIAAKTLTEDAIGENLEAMVSEEDLEMVRESMMKALGRDLRDRVQIAPLKHIKGGFQLRFDGENVVYDFSDEALAEAVCHFLNPRLAEIVSASLEQDGGK